MIEGASFGQVDGSVGQTFEHLQGARHGRLFTAAGRLDNRPDLCRALGIPTTQSTGCDADLIMAAYDQWGDKCAERLLGDWSFAAWHPSERRLALGRDHLGNTSLYYIQQGDNVAFASHLGALLSLWWVPRRLNDVKLARLLVTGPERPEEGGHTIYTDVNVLLPAHTIAITPQGHSRRSFWQLEQAVEGEAPSAAACAEALLDGLRTAIHCRVSSAERVGSTLSGGLDSTAITLLAANELARTNRRLAAFTAVPVVDPPWAAGPSRIQNEGPLAATAASSVHNIDHVLLDAKGTSPISGMRTMLQVVGQPTKSPGNAYWLVDLVSQAAQFGVKVLLTGQLGNQALSRKSGQVGWLMELRRKRLGQAARRAFGPWVPAEGKRAVRQYRFRRFWKPWDLAQSPWRSHSAIRASFAREIGFDADSTAAPSGSHASRTLALRQSATDVGIAWGPMGPAYGLSVRDPSQDVRLVSLAHSIPDRLWDGPIDRWLFRSALKGIVPDAVRLGRRRGLQAADLVDRLRFHRAELDDALAEIERSPLAQRCIDVPYCRQIAAAMDGPPDLFVASLVRAGLMRALGVGLFLAASERTAKME